MKGNAYVVLQCLLWMVCAFHLLVGAGLNLFAGLPETMAGLYGANVANWTPEFTYILKPLGAFMFALGVMAAAAALCPLKNRPIIYGFAVLFVCRALQRLVLAGDIQEIFGISGPRNLGNALFFVALAVALIVFERAASKRMSDAATT